MHSADALSHCKKLLRKHFPLAFPCWVYVTTKVIEDDWWGECYKIKRGKRITFRIRISAEGDVIDHLLHEWAHAWGWGHRHDRFKNVDWHDPAFKATYRHIKKVIYRLW